MADERNNKDAPANGVNIDKVTATKVVNGDHMGENKNGREDGGVQAKEKKGKGKSDKQKKKDPPLPQRTSQRLLKQSQPIGENTAAGGGRLLNLNRSNSVNSVFVPDTTAENFENNLLRRGSHSSSRQMTNLFSLNSNKNKQAESSVNTDRVDGQQLFCPNTAKDSGVPIEGLPTGSEDEDSSSSSRSDYIDKTLLDANDILESGHSGFGENYDKAKKEAMKLLRVLRKRQQSYERRFDSQENCMGTIELAQASHEQFHKAQNDRLNELTKVSNTHGEDISYISGQAAKANQAVTYQGRQILNIEEEIKTQGSTIREVLSLSNDLSKRVTDTYDEPTGRLESLNMDTLPSQGHSLTRHIKIDLPTFSALTGERPMRYIDNLKIYLRAMGIPKAEFKIILSLSLLGVARDWLEHYDSAFTDFDTFVTYFTNRFWGPSVQAKVRQKLERGCYEARDNLSRSEYVIRLNNDIQYVTPPIEESQVVRCFAQHFDDKVQYAIAAGTVKTISELILLLDNFDSLGNLNGESRAPRVDFSKISLLQNNSKGGVGNIATSTPRQGYRQSNFMPRANSNNNNVNNNSKMNIHQIDTVEVNEKDSDDNSSGEEIVELPEN